MASFFKQEIEKEDTEISRPILERRQDAAVFTWSMQNNKLTPASRYCPGDSVQLRLRRWADVAAKYEAINHSELENDDLLLVEPCWREE